jgi:hypothetical protein
MSKMQGAVMADFYPLDKISNQDVEIMHSVFVKYYHNADWKTFVNDLNKKIGAILLKRIDNGTIVGFSTIGIIEKEIDNKKCMGLFSGDTVIEKEYWGLPNLQAAFIRFMVKMRIKHPLVNCYWFLISKGYKTYLLMANNWSENDYYPRYGKKDDDKRKSIVKVFSNHLFQGFYDEQTGLLKFGDGYQRLKEDVAEITDEMKNKYPKISFFEKANPTWKDGTELPCLADISWSVVLYLPIAFTLRKLRNMIFGSKSREKRKKIKQDKGHVVLNPQMTMSRKTRQEI